MNLENIIEKYKKLQKSHIDQAINEAIDEIEFVQEADFTENVDYCIEVVEELKEAVEEFIKNRENKLKKETNNKEKETILEEIKEALHILSVVIEVKKNLQELEDIIDVKFEDCFILAKTIELVVNVLYNELRRLESIITPTGDGYDSSGLAEDYMRLVNGLYNCIGIDASDMLLGDIAFDDVLESVNVKDVVMSLVTYNYQ